MKQGKYLEAKNLFKEAFDTLINVYGAVNDASVTILNNISVAYVNVGASILPKYLKHIRLITAGKVRRGKETLLEAMELTKELKDATQEGILQANLGLVYLREGLMSQAENACRLAWKLGKQHQNPDAVEQAEYCLNEIKTTLNGEKRQ